MKLDDAIKLVCECISEITNGDVQAFGDMNLIGRNASLDSMKLVELCLALEDRANELGVEFDWTSESAMSKSKGFFRSVSSLAEEWHAQSEIEK